jgi:hypothetical protein
MFNKFFKIPAIHRGWAAGFTGIATEAQGNTRLCVSGTAEKNI